MKKLVLVALLFTVMLPSALAQTADSPTREEVVKLLELLSVKQNMKLMLDGMKTQMQQGAQQGFKSKVPDATPAQLQQMNAIIDDVFSEISIDELVEVIIPIYQRHLTRTDIKGIVSFYMSPVGQKMLREQPAMVQESMTASSELMEKKMQTLLTKIDARMQELVRTPTPEATKTKSAPEATKTKSAPK